MAGELCILVKTPTGSFYHTQKYPNISLGSPFGFEAGSCLLTQNNSQGWSCGSAGIVDVNGNIGAAIYIRKHEDQGKYKIDFQDIEIRNGRTYHPTRNPHTYGYNDVHHKPIEPWTVTVTWIPESGTAVFIDTKEL